MTDTRPGDDFDADPQDDTASHRSDDESGPGKLAELLDGVRTCMLTTIGPDGTLVSRPMAVQDTVFSDSEGSLWLFATKDSPKAQQVEADAHVGVTVMTKDTWISIDGRAELVDDRERIHEYWNPFVEAWFPGGPDDPNVTLLRVVGESAQYWETSGSRVTTMLKMLRSAVTHEPATDVGTNEKMEL